MTSDIIAAVDLLGALTAPVVPLLPAPVAGALAAVLGLARSVAAARAQWREAISLAHEAVDAWTRSSVDGRARVRRSILAAIVRARQAAPPAPDTEPSIYDEELAELGPGNER